MHTPEDARGMLCPVARTFASKVAYEGCQGPACMAWRWEKVMAGSARWKAAIRAEAERTGERQPYPKAAQALAEDPAAHGLVADRGFCGMGGTP